MILSRKYIYGFHSILILVLFCVSCKNKTETFIAKGKEYFNYAPGQVRDYDMDSAHYDWISGKLKSWHFLIKERVIDTFTDLAGHVALRIEQYISRDTGKNYQFYKLQSVYSDEFGCQRVIDNQRYLRMVFPVSLKKKWNGNMYNAMGAMDYKYTGVGISFANPYLSNDNCIEVTQQDDSTLISRDRQVEIYGKDAGLFYRYDKSIEYNAMGQPQGHIITWNLRYIRK